MEVSATLLVVSMSAGCRERVDGRSASVAATSGSTTVGVAAASALPSFRIVAKLHAAGWAAPTDAGAPYNPRAQQVVRDHLQAPAFAAALQRCYLGQSSIVPPDTTVLLGFDHAGKLTRSVLEGVATPVAPCVNALFGALSIPELAAGNTSAEGGTVHGLLDVQTR